MYFLCYMHRRGLFLLLDNNPIYIMDLKIIR